MLTIHHLGVSQSERILWLCEELGLEYKLIKHTRDPVTAPESLKSTPGNETGKSPFIEDPDEGITLSESGAICEYIITKYGNGKLALGPDDKHYSEYLHWYHFGNGTLLPVMVCIMFLDFASASSSDAAKFAHQRLHDSLKIVDDRLSDNKWLSGEEFTAADIMNVFPLTTQRYFGPLVSLAPYPHILRYLGDCADRPAYQRGMEKGDAEMKPLIGAEPPEASMLAVGGVGSDHWKKAAK